MSKISREIRQKAAKTGRKKKTEVSITNNLYKIKNCNRMNHYKFEKDISFIRSTVKRLGAPPEIFFLYKLLCVVLIYIFFIG